MSSGLMCNVLSNQITNAWFLARYEVSSLDILDVKSAARYDVGSLARYEIDLLRDIK